MKSTDRNGKNLEQDSNSSTYSSQRGADRRVEQILADDRRHLSGKHNPERSRARVMGVLAASAMPAASGGGVLSWISQLVGGKGVVGTLSLVAVTGGVSLATVVLTQSTDTVPSDPKKTEQVNTALPTQIEPPTVAPSVTESQLPDMSASNADGSSEEVETRPATNTSQSERASAIGEDMPPTSVSHPADTDKNESTTPEEYRKHSTRTSVNIDSVIIQKK